MFIGHFAVGFAARRASARVPLVLLVAAPILLDLLWPLFLLVGWERVSLRPGSISPFLNLDFDSYPISHSLLAVAGWALLLGAGYFAARRDLRGALLVGLLVLSHYLLDWVTHIPDLPLTPTGTARVGLGLWTHALSAFLIESAMYAAGVVIYLRATRARDRAGSLSAWALIAFLALIYLASLLSPPPPSERAVAFAALSLWILLPWAVYIDRHRETLPTSPARSA